MSYVKIGVAGPVGSGKTALIESLTRKMAGDYSIGVITNALVIDYTGIFKADIGIRDGKIAGIGKAGNPDIMYCVTKGMSIGASTEALAGEGMILTAGGIDTHIHFICPQPVSYTHLKPDPYLKGYEWAAGLSGAQ